MTGNNESVVIRSRCSPAVSVGRVLCWICRLGRCRLRFQFCFAYIAKLLRILSNPYYIVVLLIIRIVCNNSEDLPAGKLDDTLTQIRLFDGFVFLQQLQADVAHVLAFLAKAEEDLQSSQPRVDGCDPIALLHLMADEVLHDLPRDLADALHRHASLEVTQILFVVFQRSRRDVLQTTVTQELFNDVFQCLLTNCVYLFDLPSGH